jgi:uncharacterized protein YihD (DUF1040 family)
MQNKIIISDKFRDYIEGLEFEKRSRFNLLNFMLSNNIQNEKMFEQIHTEYTEFYIQYELARKKLEQIYIIPRYKDIYQKGFKWRLDFKSREVTIDEEI